MKSQNKYSTFRVAMGLAALIAGNSLFASQDATVTVHPGNDHTFYGFGFNHTHWRDPYDMVDQQFIDSLLTLLYGPDELNANYLRVFSHPKYTWDPGDGGGERVVDGELQGERYSRIYQNIKTIQPDIQFLWCPWNLDSCQKDLRGYAEWAVRIAKEMGEEYPLFQWSATGVFNEPQNDPTRIDEKHIVDLVRYFREELDNQGMGHVKIIAPECSNVLDWDPPGENGSHVEMLRKIMNDSEANSMVDAWGYHSYDYGPTKWFRDMLRPTGKDIWQTESALHGAEGGEEEIHYAAQQAAIALSDINLLANRWFYYHDFNPRGIQGPATIDWGDAFNMFYITQTGQGTYRLDCWLKFHFMRRLGQSFKPNTEIRWCTSDLEPWFGNDTDRFTYMENTNRDISGESSQICAAAGRREDSSWVLSAVNRTGMPGIHQDTVFNGDGTVAWMKHTYAPADSYDVTFDVAELAESGELTFRVTRCNKDNKCFEDGTVSMNDGLVTVATAPTELVTLESSAGVPITAVRRGSARPIGSVGMFAVKNAGADWVIEANLHGVQTSAAMARIYDCRGRLVRTLRQSGAPGSSIALRWDTCNGSGARVASGAYRVRLSVAGRTVTALLNVID